MEARVNLVCPHCGKEIECVTEVDIEPPVNEGYY